MYITANVPITEIGSARLGMSVADTLRRNRKITSTTRHERQHERELHVVHRLANRRRAVVHQLHLDAGRESASAASSISRLDGVGDGDGVVPGWR